MTNYETGTVAKATVRGVPDTIVVKSDTEDWFTANPFPTPRGITEYDHKPKHVTDIRPLVLLDLSRWESETLGPQDVLARLRMVASFGHTTGHAKTNDIIGDIADQIEAQTKPPKPQREKGWYEVDDDGTVRVYWWDGSGWRYGPGGAGPLAVEGGGSVRVTRLDVA